MAFFKRRSSPPDGTVIVPDGHEVTVYGPTLLPELQQTRGGTLVVNLGAASDEFQEELRRIVEQIDHTEATESAKQSPVLVTTEVGKMSDLFAPHDIAVDALPGLLIWILDADSAHLWLHQPEPLLEAIRRAGTHIDGVGDGPITRIVMIAIEWRPTATATGRHEGQRPQLRPPPGTEAFVRLLSGTEVPILQVPGDGVCFVEVVRPDAVIGSPRGEDITDLVAAGADDPIHDVQLPCHYVIRAPRLRRLILAAMEEPSENGRGQLYEELLGREIALLVMSDRRGGVRPMTWPDHGTALPVFPDLLSLRHAVEDLQMDTNDVTWVHFRPRELFAWVEKAPFPCVAMNAYKDRQTALYLRLDRDEVSALARGEMPA